MAAILVMAAIGAWALMTERISYVVTSGVSMNPVYYQGDLVFVRKADSYHIGEIVAYHGSVPGQKVLHRIIGGNSSSGFVFKGDNNQSTDPLRPAGDQLIGHAALLVPNGGYWLKPLLGPTGLGMIGFLFVGSGTAVARNRREVPRGRRKKKVKAMSRQGGSLTAAAAILNLIKRLPPVLRAAAAVVALVAVIGLVLGVLGWMKPPYQTRKVAHGPQRSMTYSYSAKVPRSAAYDGTTVASPDPIFRRLASRIDLHVAYSGPAGTFGLTARLTNGTGWHTSMQLVKDTAFTGTSYRATVPLDLAALTARSDAASQAIGASKAGAVSVELNAHVKSSGLGTLQAPLNLQIDAMQMVLGNGANLTTGGSADATTITVARELRVFSWSVMNAAQARSYALLLLIIAALGAFGIFFVIRRNTVVRTRAEIERRYPQLLVHVEPMASPPGKPVVNVDNFPALVKLAERYGQMILTWRRPDADDFVVRDEGITYRYRVPLDEPTLQNVELIDRPPGAGTHRRRAASEVS
ncbi:signal peptidase I [Actinoplanes sp. NPDC051411]|uniref:signal peptidase I n=1 Tax=Actinoplanes sp. NPDC051411 TaxID=3155522 RepID=UPI003448966D